MNESSIILNVRYSELNVISQFNKNYLVGINDDNYYLTSIIPTIDYKKWKYYEVIFTYCTDDITPGDLVFYENKLHVVNSMTGEFLVSGSLKGVKKSEVEKVIARSVNHKLPYSSPELLDMIMRLKLDKVIFRCFNDENGIDLLTSDSGELVLESIIQ